MGRIGGRPRRARRIAGEANCTASGTGTRSVAPIREAGDASGRPIRLEIDGGVKVDNAAEVAAAGIDTFVAGSAVFGAKDYGAVISALKAEIAKGD